MFNSSLRRVARTCPNSVLCSRPSPTASHGQIAATFATHCHQRRNSSSKPPIPPNNGSPPIPAASVKQVGAPRSTDKRPGVESRLSKRKVTKTEKVEVSKPKEDYSSEWTRSLPSVPSTQHLNPKDVYVASFFSTHRPISISGPLPPETSIEDIEKIFQVRPRNQRRPQDVIYTISNVLQNLDENVATQQQQQQAAQHEEGVTQRADIIKALTQHNNSATNPADSNVIHLDGQPQQQQQNTANLRVPPNVKLVIQALARQFRPFNPPPAPVAAPEVEFYPTEEQEATTTTSRTSTTQTATTTQESATQEQTANTFFTPSFQQTSRRTHRATLLPRHLRQLHHFRIRDVRRIGGIKEILLISVRRQRKLKMKKHKYKKLMRKTRNLRRRQGKI
ncbi:hypothetical protein LTR64_002405 [Lithohypha guttulata]|uniref:uncharacterized protein n=1 Tax=Lithohypha guttulata TaxID=1690604 RepID=UPI002DE13028|nr:hypothetical protein LTR51_001370 [Lithohypha guttulata]